MKLEQRIYCIEGVWDYGGREVEPSVEPMLEMLRRQGQWASYARRDCATTGEFKHYIEHEWCHRCKTGSVLYIASHGSEGGIWLSDDHPLGLDTLGDLLAERCEHCLVHFGGCEVLGGDEDTVRRRVKTFLDKTNAMGVSGYSVETGWTGAWAPALGLELMLFSSIKEDEIQLENGRHFSALRRVVERLQKRFEDCGFGSVHANRRAYSGMISLAISAVAGDEPPCRERRVPVRRAWRR